MSNPPEYPAATAEPATVPAPGRRARRSRPAVPALAAEDPANGATEPAGPAEPRLEYLPLYEPEDARRKAAEWRLIGLGAAGVALLLGAGNVLLATLGDDDLGVEAIPVTWVVLAAGLLLLCVAVGLLHGEAVRVKPKEEPTLAPGTDLSGVVKELVTAMRSLSAARAIALVGVVLVVAAVWSGGA